MSRMKGSRYLVISYFRAPRLLLRSRATGERDRERQRKREKKRERGPRPITGPVRVTGDRGRGREAMGRESEKKRTHHCFQPASPSLSHFYLCPPSLTHPLTPDFLFPLSPSLPLCPLSIFSRPPPISLTSSLSLSPLGLCLPPPPLLPFKHSGG